ncbi:hypothetical protein GGX14DRAFT_406395 [Mycena pura]|uniref:Uncharacterized protein n=1 Tax=Mycena pura TaxID=153505 RepID=A0AAD6US82_9AGAR|nr:hypothetical protein GGX14DRAFT_406395 [Mycena pura]
MSYSIVFPRVILLVILLPSSRSDPGLQSSVQRWTRWNEGMDAWTIVNFSLAVSQYQRFRYVCMGTIVINILQNLYILDFFYHEECTRTIYFGFYLAWGGAAWIPSMYTLQAQYLAHYPSNLSQCSVIGCFGPPVTSEPSPDAREGTVKKTGIYHGTLYYFEWGEAHEPATVFSSQASGESFDISTTSPTWFSGSHVCDVRPMWHSKRLALRIFRLHDCGIRHEVGCSKKYGKEHTKRFY